LKVPCGTTVHDHSHNLLLRDLVELGDEVVVAKGGRGGYGNHRGRPQTMGEDGESLELLLSFTILADIFLVGLPNSGKTTLLRSLTRANIQPTDYPFATKQPCLGTYGARAAQFQICELPSVYGHSSEGRGLGNVFLKHLKRAKLIFLVLDPLNPFARGLKEGYDILVQSIREFDPGFLDIRRLVVVNKMDLKGAEKTLRSKQLKCPEPVFEISAAEGTGVKKLMREAVRIIRKNG